jgi:hypothetical protein
MAYWWGAQYWRARHNVVLAHLGIRIWLEKHEAGEAFRIFDEPARWESRLLALDHALDATCDKHGIDANAVRQSARTEPMVCTAKLDRKYERGVRRTLGIILTGSD